MRLRREYLYRKAQEDRLRSIEEKKQKLEGALDGRRMQSFCIFFYIVIPRIKCSNDLTIHSVSLQKTVSFPQKCAKMRLSYRNCWSMTIPALKASDFSLLLL